MPHPVLHSSLLFALLVSCGLGCRLLDSPWSAAPSLSEAELRDVTAALEQDLWRENRGWSPLAGLERYPRASAAADEPRWAYGSRHVSETVIAQGRNVEGLAGWNAALLAAQRNPSAAKDLTSVLESLATDPAQLRPVPAWPMLTALTHHPFEFGASVVANDVEPSVKLSMKLRAAAAEAWCRVLAANASDPEQALLPAGRALQAADLPGEIRGELFRGIAVHVPPTRIPGLASALERPTDGDAAPVAGGEELRRAAIDACVVHAVAVRSRSGRQETDSDQTSSATSIGDAISEELADDELLLDASAIAERADSLWPVEIWGLQYDPDPRVRQRFGDWLAVTGATRALELLQAQLNDQEAIVRENALVCLGVLGTPPARNELQRQAERSEERLRMLAVRGLSLQGPRVLAPFAQDSAAIVRAEVVQRLRQYPEPEAARILRSLLADSHLDVQLRTVAAVREFPDELAQPVLLQSLAESALKTRQAALAQLKDRRQDLLQFPLDAPAQERAARVAEIGRQWSLPDTLMQDVRELARRGSTRSNAARLTVLQDELQVLTRELEGAVATEAVESKQKGTRSASSSPTAVAPASRTAAIEAWLARLQADDLPLLEQLLARAETEGRTGEAGVLRQHALPQFSPAWSALLQLSSADVAARRQGAQQLMSLGARASLPPELMTRLQVAMRNEQDRLVWRYVMAAVGPDNSDAAAQLALLAVNNTWPDVRVLGCEYIGRQGRAPHAVWLLPLVQDDNALVRLAAVKAVGHCRNPIVLDGLRSGEGEPSLRGLRPLLTEAQGPLRFAAIVSMSQIGDDQAMQELNRQSYDSSPLVRLSVVQAMGETGQTRFIESLIRLAWTETNRQVKIASVASLQRLVPPDQSPVAGDEKSGNLDQTIEMWAAWWENRKQVSTVEAHSAGRSG